MNLLHTIEIPSISLFNQANASVHWTVKNKHKKRLQTLIKYQWLIQKIKNISTPCLVKITRCSPRKYDSDNYIYNCKGIRDQISSLIKPGLAPGRADDKGDIEWKYEQIKAKTHSMIIEIYN